MSNIIEARLGGYTPDKLRGLQRQLGIQAARMLEQVTRSPYTDVIYGFTSRAVQPLDQRLLQEGFNAFKRVGVMNKLYSKISLELNRKARGE